MARVKMMQIWGLCGALSEQGIMVRGSGYMVHGTEIHGLTESTGFLSKKVLLLGFCWALGRLLGPRNWRSKFGRSFPAFQSRM